MEKNLILLAIFLFFGCEKSDVMEDFQCECTKEVYQIEIRTILTEAGTTTTQAVRLVSFTEEVECQEETEAQPYGGVYSYDIICK